MPDFTTAECNCDAQFVQSHSRLVPKCQNTATAATIRKLTSSTRSRAGVRSSNSEFRGDRKLFATYCSETSQFRVSRLDESICNCRITVSAVTFQRVTYYSGTAYFSTYLPCFGVSRLAELRPVRSKLSFMPPRRRAFAWFYVLLSWYDCWYYPDSPDFFEALASSQ